MKKIYKLLFFIITIFSTNSLFSQAASYSFAATSGTFTVNSGAATLLPLVRADGYLSTAQSIGFNFVYEGITYTQFKMSSDGYITFNTAASSTLLTNNFSTANATSRPILGPLWDDLDGSGPVNSLASFEVTGSSPNRILTVEWLNWEWNYNSTTPVLSFQVKLFETSNVIQYVYRQETGAVNSGSASIGIGSAAGSGSGSYLNLNNSTASPTPSSTTTTTNISSKPATGQVYTWTPPFCIAPTALVSSNITGTTATIGWTASGSASSYDWELRTTGSCGSGSPIQSGNTASTSVNLLTLTANTTYTYCVRSACTGPTESGWVSGTFTTSCSSTTPPYTQDFESVTTPAIPACTSIQNAGTGNNWTTNSPSSYGFTSKALRYSYSTTNDANAWFFTQGLTLTTGTTYKLTYKYGSAGFDESLKVNIGTSPNAAAMTTNLADHPLVTTSPITNTVYFTVPSNGTYYVGYNAYSIADQFYLFVDDINIIVAPTCDGPSGIVASAITQNSATISWTAPAPPPANGYDYIYSTSSTPPTGMSTPSGSTGAGITTTNLTSLTSSTLYYVWVRSVCSGVDKSNWVAMPSFTTSVDCSTAPVLSCATPVTSGNLATSGGLIPSNPCFSSPGNEKLYSFTSTTAGTYTLNITSINGGSGYIDYQFKLASAGCGAGGWTCIGDMSSVGTTTFTLAAATQYYIMLDAESATGTTNHTFQIDCPAACPAPLASAATLLTSTTANANWTPTTGSFIIEYGPTSTFGTPGTGAIAGNVNNLVVTAMNVGTKQLIGLLPTTGYSYVVRLDCTGSANGYSLNSSTITFTTLAAPPANDEAAGAIALVVGSGCTGAIYNNNNATAGVNEPNNCQGAPFKTVWFSFVAPASGAVRVSNDEITGSLDDSRIAIHSASNVNNYTTFTVISCDEDNGTVNGLRSIAFATGLQAGSTYYVSVGTYDGSTSTGTFCITVDELNATMIALSGSCAVMQSPFGSNALYTGFVSFTNASGQLVALVKNPTGASATSYINEAVTVNSGPVRSDANGKFYLDRNFRMTNTSAGPYDVVFFFLDSELASLTAADPATTLANLKVTRTTGETGCTANYVTGNNPNNGLLGQTSNGSVGGVNWLGFTTPGFSQFFVSRGNTALPVNILSFDAKALNNKTVQLTWNVAAEVDVREYIVERSNDNRNWSAIGSVKASQKSTYGFNDNSPVSGVNYYRLAVKDVNASVAYSDIRTVNFSGKGNMALYPNPANNTLYVSGTDDKNVVVSIYNEVGQIVNTLSSNGETIRTGGIDVSQLLPGAYSIQVKGESGLTTMRFVKQ